MNTEQIKKLLESFYNGQISPSGELLLKNYFDSNNIASELVEEGELFIRFYEDSESTEIPHDLETKLEFLIDELDAKEQKSKLTIRQSIKFISIAACVAIIITAGIYVSRLSFSGDNDLFLDYTEENAETQISDNEYIEIENALRLFSSNFNKGLEQLDEVNDSLAKTNEILNRTFKIRN